MKLHGESDKWQFCLEAVSVTDYVNHPKYWKIGIFRNMDIKFNICLFKSVKNLF